MGIWFYMGFMVVLVGVCNNNEIEVNLKRYVYLLVESVIWLKFFIFGKL